jgi:hypothetical protein
MAAASLARGRSDENDAPQVSRIRPHVRKSRSSRVRQTKYNEKAASPDETSRDLSGESSAIEAR